MPLPSPPPPLPPASPPPLPRGVPNPSGFDIDIGGGEARMEAARPTGLRDLVLRCMPPLPPLPSPSAMLARASSDELGGIVRGPEEDGVEMATAPPPPPSRRMARYCGRYAATGLIAKNSWDPIRQVTSTWEARPLAVRGSSSGMGPGGGVAPALEPALADDREVAIVAGRAQHRGRVSCCLKH